MSSKVLTLRPAGVDYIIAPFLGLKPYSLTQPAPELRLKCVGRDHALQNPTGNHSAHRSKYLPKVNQSSYP